ncbi:MAG: TonB-dependent receptor [Spongiibacteraceae bacterium]
MKKSKITRCVVPAAFLLLSSIAGHIAAADTESLNDVPLPDALTPETIIPEVLTPVRLKQPRTEVPASVSVIDANMIAASGIRELPEIFRLIPGMAVGARSGWDYIVSYHGMNRYNSHRMQVMIDGRSIYQAGLANIDWSDIPLAMEDIERIEVTRGPNTAAYGANSFLGIINIITKHPDDNPQLRVKATSGNNATNDFYASTSDTLGSGSYRLTAATKRDSGFDEKASGETRRDGKDTKFINGRWILMPTEDWQLDLQAGYKTGVKQDDKNGYDFSPRDQDVDSYFTSVRSQHFLSTTNSLKWQLDLARSVNKLEWRTCESLNQLSSSFSAAPDDWLLCGDVNENSRNERVDLDIQDTWLSEGPWKVVSGAHIQYQNVKSETFYSGAEQRDTYQLFANIEYRLLPELLLNVGGSQEYFEQGRHEFSPRLALLFLPNENHSIRAVYSEAIRTPDLFESRLKWHYIVSNIETVPANLTQLPSQYVLDTLYTPENLEPERIRSRELGYYSLWWNRRLEWDIKLFNDEMDNLISDNVTYSGYSPDNAGIAEQRGGETEVKLHINDTFVLHFSGAVIDSSANTFREETITPHTSGSIGVIYQLTPQWQLSSFYYYQNRINDALFARWDNRVAKSWNILSSKLTVSAVIQHYRDENTDLLRDNVYDGLNRIYFSADLMF